MHRALPRSGRNLPRGTAARRSSEYGSRVGPGDRTEVPVGCRRWGASASSVGAEVERGGLDRGIRLGFEVGLDGAGRDLGGATLDELAHERGCGAADDAEVRVLLEAGTGIGDVEVAHRELADAVLRAEGLVADALHRE